MSEEQKNTAKKIPPKENTVVDEQPTVSSEPKGEQAEQATGANGSTASEDETQKLKQELELTQNKLNEVLDSAKRGVADFANFRRRNDEDKKNWIIFANTNLINDLLPVLESCKLAEDHIPETEKKNEWVNGILLTFKQLEEVLKKAGVKKVLAEIGGKFNPEFHEAIGEGAGEKGAIIEIFSCGFLLGEKLLKPARVKVGNGETVGKL